MDETVLANPYIGPTSFTEKDSSRFFGRTAEVAELASLIVARRAVLLYAQSGSGKTSLLQASLIPELKQRKRVAVFPIARITGAAGLSGSLYVENALANLFPKAPAGAFKGQTFSEAIGAALAAEMQADAPTRRQARLLIFDQFEEIFSYHPELTARRQEFFQQLGDCLAAYPQLSLLLSMREDYLADLEAYTSLLPDRLRSRMRMERLGVEGALEAIQKPAALGGLPFAKGVAETLVDNLRRIQTGSAGANEFALGRYVEPVQLQIVCRQLWSRVTADPAQIKPAIDAADVKMHANVDGALIQFYRDCLAEAQKGVTERALRRWFDKPPLITKAGTRGLVYYNEKEKEAGGLPAAALFRLCGAYIVRSDQRGANAYYELAHDRLVEPVRTDNREWFDANLEPVEKVSEVWEREGQPEGMLFVGEDLEKARKWQAANQPGPNDRETRFIAASEKKQLQIEQERRNAIRLKLALCASLLALGVAILFFVRAHRATAQANATLAGSAIVNAGYLLNPQLHRYRMDGAMAYAASALRADPGAKIAKYWVSNLLLYGDWYSSNEITAQVKPQPGQGGSTKFDGSINFSVDGKFALVQNADRTAQVKDTETGDIKATMNLHEFVADAWLSPGGQLALIAFRDEKVELWSATGGGQSHRISPEDCRAVKASSLKFAVFSKSGKWLVTGFEETCDEREQAGKISTLLWRINPLDGSIEEKTSLELGEELQTAAFSPDPGERTFVTASRQGVRIWQTVPGTKTGFIHERVDSVAYSPDGRYLLTSEAVSAQVWDALTGTRVGGLLRHPDLVTSAVFSSENPNWVITTCYDGGARVWNFKTGMEITSIFHDFPVRFAQVFTSTAAGGGKGYMAITGGTNIVQPWYLDGLSEDGLSSNGSHPNPAGSPLPDAEPFRSGTFITDDAGILTASGDGTNHGAARKWRVTKHFDNEPSRRPAPARTDPDDSLISAYFSTDGTHLVAVWGKGRTHHEIQMLDSETGKAIGKPIRNVHLQAWNGDLSLLLTYSGSSLQVWDALTSVPKGSPIQVKGSVRGGDLSKYGSVAALSDEIKVLDVGKRDLAPLQLKTEAGKIYFITISDDGRKLLTASEDGSLQFWDTKTGREIPGTGQNNKQRFRWASFSRDGRRAVAQSGQTVWIYTIDRPDRTIQVDLQDDARMAILSGDKLVTNCCSDTAEIWDANTGRSTSGPLPHDASLRSIAFSSDGLLMATAYGSKAQLWDLQTGKRIGWWLDNGDDDSSSANRDLVALAFSSDGKRLFSIDESGDTRTWPILIGDETETGLLAQLAEAVAGTRVRNQAGSAGAPTGTLEMIPTAELEQIKTNLRKEYGRRGEEPLLKQFLGILLPHDKVKN